MECLICRNCFNSVNHIPKLLSCKHTFCSCCLVILMKEHKILCPICRQETTFPSSYSSERVVLALITNFSMLEKTKINKNDQSEKDSQMLANIPSQNICSTQVVDTEAEVSIFAERTAEIPESTTELPERTAAPRQPLKNIFCCPIVKMFLYILYNVMRLIADLCLFIVIGLIVGYMAFLKNTESRYFEVNLIFLFSSTGLEFSIWSLLMRNSENNHCTCSENVERIFKLVLVVSLATHVGAAIYGLVKVINDSQNDCEDHLYILAIVTEIITAISMISVILILSIKKINEFFQLNLALKQFIKQ